MSKLITISELSKKLGLINSSKNKSSNYILRYWEREFKQIKPKIINKRRYYSTDQVIIIKFIKTLLKDNGMTIKGVKKILSSNKELDYNKLHGLSADYYKTNIKERSKFILERIKKLRKTYGKKNAH
ncbi:MAG: MerR family transcriptional regulator [Pseudomonadota bacterium]|nr:MerR family transcriptional regulator [Pseudomonadota bacterium]